MRKPLEPSDDGQLVAAFVPRPKSRPFVTDQASRREFLIGSAATVAVAAVGVAPSAALEVDDLLVKVNCVMGYSYIDRRIFSPVRLMGRIEPAWYEFTPIIFNGRHFEPTAGWSNPWPYGTIRANTSLAVI